ncbi:MAG: heterodisulfide reductase-related iron-sulfur binding cluster [Deltaproteobacteria bacterium]|nr:heterodisulfide reductase-related iron-sulfur binding cluster [Deltaproteobacteria bacterium]
MVYAYYPGCSLKGSAKKLDVGIRKVFGVLGMHLEEIPDWNCCGAVEYGDASEIRSMSRKNLFKALKVSTRIIAPCPLCSKNLKESDGSGEFSILHPLDVLSLDFLMSIPAKKDLKGYVITPYYGCLLLRPKETAIKDKEIMEKVILSFGGQVAGEEIKDKCCGGNKFFVDKEIVYKLSKIVLKKSSPFIVVFCPLCHMVLKTFSEGQKVLYFTDLILYILGEKKEL